MIAWEGVSVKEAICIALSEEIRKATNPNLWVKFHTSVRRDHGCCEFLIRGDDDHAFKLFELTLAEEDSDDIWIYFHEDYANEACTMMKLCEPDWIDRVIRLIQEVIDPVDPRDLTNYSKYIAKRIAERASRYSS
jgi:hypothetical protein